MRFVIAAFSVLALTGCAEHNRQVDTERCAGYGFHPGTDQFAQCLMYQDGQRRQAGGIHPVKAA
jgi:hypothetical protein